MSDIKYIDEADIQNKRVLLRVDFNVTLNPDFSIADDYRIRQAIPTIEYLLKKNNRLIIVSHLGRPKGRDGKFSLKPVVDDLKELLPHNQILLINDFLTTEDQLLLKNQTPDTIMVLENIRFYEEEKNNDPDFVNKLAGLADTYVNDAFGVAHRTDASVVGIAKKIPGYGGLLLKKEIKTLDSLIGNPQKPVVAIIGGAKISTKINLLGRLMNIADQLIIAGGLANTFFCAEGLDIGSSFCEYTEVEHARKLLFMASGKHVSLQLPTDVVVDHDANFHGNGEVKKVKELSTNDSILDIGPETQAEFAATIMKAKTIVWNGPVGYIENPSYRRGTDFIYYAITQNPEAVSIIGGGDTLATISKKEYLEKITHVSTGGGAMLEYIEKGTLPGIAALKK